MRSTILVALLTALPLAAQDKKLSCENQNWGDRAHFCEVREQTIAAAGRLEVDGRTNGGVSVKGWDRPDVLVRSQVNAQGENDGDARAIGSQVIVHAVGTQVSADGPSGKSWSVSYEVFVPRQMDLALSAHNGGIHIEGVRGNITFNTQNGGVHLANIAGAVKGRTQNGGVHVELAGNRWDGQGLEVETQNGGVHIAVPASFAAHFESSTVNGGLKSDFADMVTERRQRQVSRDLNGGGATIRVVTTNGGVTIQKTT
jgi:DUF4097 and DUF4098 domain-containing protein YvlB